MQEDIQCAVRIHAPPMLDRTDCESLQHIYVCYCLGKIMDENIMKSIKEDHFKWKGSQMFIAEELRVHSTRGLKESNFDQLYAYLKQHEVHANENRIMMERFSQPNNDPLALVSDASVQQYPTQSSKSPQSSAEPYPSDSFQMDSGSSSTEKLIESLSNSLALLTQSYKSHLPQTNNQLRASSNARNKAMVQDGKVVVQDVRGRYNANNQGRPFQRNNARGNGVAGNVGGQNRGGIINPGQAKPIKCYNCNGLGHIARELLDEEQSLFLAGEQVTNVDDDVDDSPENDLALNYMEDNEDHVVQRDVSSVRNDALMSILDEMHEQGVQSRLANKLDMVVNDSVTSELARYKELVGDLVTTNHTPTVIHDSEDTLELAEITRNRMLLKMQSPLYDENRKKAETLAPKPISALTVYPPNTPVKLVPRVLPTKSQVKINLYVLTQLFTEFDKTKTRITPTALVNKYKEMEEIFGSNENEVDKNNYRLALAEIGVNDSTEASGSKPRSNTKKNRILPAKKENKRSRNIGYQWRPTGKKLALGKLDCGYQWRPTGKKFALDEMCHLTKLSVKCRTGHALVSGLRLFKTYDGKSFKAHEFCGKVPTAYTTWRTWINLFSVGQFCDSDLEVAFRKHTCFVRDIKGTDILKGSRGTNLYTISIDEMMKSSPICLLSKASKTIWFRGLPRLKFEKDHLCSACQLGKSKKFSHRPKSENTNMEVLHTLHMDLCGPMRVQSIKGKKYILVIVDDYSRFTWVKFLRSKDETPEFVTNFLKQIQVWHISSKVCFRETPQQNGVVERPRHWVVAARTMMIFSKLPYKQADLTFFRVFGALCYPTNDSENLGKFQAKADIGIFVGYAPSRKGYRIYNKRTRRLMETIHVTFDSRVHQSIAPVRMSYSLSTTIAQDAPSTSASSSTSDIHHPVQHQEIAEEPTHEDTPINHDVLHPSHNLVTRDPGSAQSSSRNVNSAEPIQVNYPPDHLRRWTKDHPLDNIVGNPLLDL
ncbi:retrovirus-related pol polyprotein from transposon TNT 1-94 [Tanacetum coccineum]